MPLRVTSKLDLLNEVGIHEDGWYECVGDHGTDASHRPNLCKARIPLEIIYSDGGDFTEHYGSSNILNDDDRCYCTRKSRGANLIARHVDSIPFTLTFIDVAAPREGYTCPLGSGIIFSSWDYPSVEATSIYDKLETYEEIDALMRKQQRENVAGDPKAPTPILYFELIDTYRARIQLDVPRSGRFLLIKLLRPRTQGNNIDSQYLGFYGWTGRVAFASAELL